MPPPTLPASAYDALELPSETVKVLTNLKPPPSSPESAASPNLLQANPPSAQQALSPNETSITLYAELLLHIRTITVFASLQSFHTRETKATLSADGTSITVSHEGESATIQLPIKSPGGGDAALSLPAKPPSKDLTLRLQLEEKDGSDLLGREQAEERKLNLVPWDGASLNARDGVEILCKSCQSIIVPRAKLREWRDLPNENWAEMMDFWHCHKPDEHHLHSHTHDESTDKKGYAAGNRLTAVQGRGFVDLASMLLHEQDCENVEGSSESDINELLCKQCNHVVGTPDETASGWRIWKWSIGVSRPASPSNKQPSFNVQKWISARLLFLIENTGLRKILVHPDTTKGISVPSLLLWAFTPDLIFSSSISSRDRRDPTRAMKIFYQAQTFMPSEDGAQGSSSIEEVAFPKQLYEELKRALEESQQLLPVSARKFQGWDVGLLGRFDAEDVM